ncbi:hypothetical protein OG21DRAFT_1067573 [Imleria badia]|nr:hypothetical protein OG21DRAFT_1067573 [Imleria badia]
MVMLFPTPSPVTLLQPSLSSPAPPSIPFNPHISPRSSSPSILSNTPRRILVLRLDVPILECLRRKLGDNVVQDSLVLGEDFARCARPTWACDAWRKYDLLW